MEIYVKKVFFLVFNHGFFSFTLILPVSQL